jgi:hypothetical protein
MERNSICSLGVGFRKLLLNLPISEMRRSFRNERDYGHEKPSAVLHLQTTQKFQGRNNDRDRPWGHLEPLLHAQRRRRGRRPRPLPNQPVRSRQAFQGFRASPSCHGNRNPFDLVSEQIQELGHEVIVANVGELRAISHSDRKSDKVDAEKIARYARLDPSTCRSTR